MRTTTVVGMSYPINLSLVKRAHKKLASLTKLNVYTTRAELSVFLEAKYMKYTYVLLAQLYDRRLGYSVGRFSTL